MLKTIQQKIGSRGLWVIGCLVVGGLLFGSGYWSGRRALPQGTPASAGIASSKPWYSSMTPNFERSGSTSTNPATVTPEMKEFSDNRATLNAKMAELRSHGDVTPQAVAEFQKQNADLLTRQRELGKIISQQNAKNPIPTPPPLQIPPNASPQMKTFLTERDQLMRDQIAFMNLHRNDDPAARQAAVQQWRQQNASRFEQVQKDAQDIPQASTSKPVSKAPTNPGK